MSDEHTTSNMLDEMGSFWDDLADDTFGYLAHLGLYARALGYWLITASAIGMLSGLLGSAFHIGVELASEFRLAHPLVLWT